MDDIDIRKQVYAKITHLLNHNVNLHTIFETLDIPKTTNMNGITVNLSAISSDDISEISSNLMNVSYHPVDIVDLAEPEPLPTIQPKPKSRSYKRLKLSKAQKLILSVL